MLTVMMISSILSRRRVPIQRPCHWPTASRYIRRLHYNAMRYLMLIHFYTSTIQFNTSAVQCNAGLTQSLSLYPGWATPTAEWSSHYDGEDDENDGDYDDNDGGEDDGIMSQQCWVNICAGLESELWLTLSLHLPFHIFVFVFAFVFAFVVVFVFVFVCQGLWWCGAAVISIRSDQSYQHALNRR